MFRVLLSGLVVMVFAVSCLKRDNSDLTCPYRPSQVNVPASEIAAVENYLDSMGITAQKDTAGYYYNVISAGSGGSDSMGLCSQIQINYVGKLTNDTIFDQQNGVVFVLGELIEGWKRSIPKLRKGGEMNLYLPPTLGYGPIDRKNQQGQTIIPANSILVFNVKLLDYTASY